MKKLDEILKELHELDLQKKLIDLKIKTLKEEAMTLLKNKKSYSNDYGSISRVEVLKINQELLPDKYKVKEIVEKIDRKAVKADLSTLKELGIVEIDYTSKFLPRKKNG